MKIAILVEGATEKAFKQILLDFLKLRLQQQMPKLKFIPKVVIKAVLNTK